MRGLFSVAVAVIMSIGILAQTGVPHPVPRVPTNESTPAAGESATPVAGSQSSAGCNDLADYTDQLNQAANDSGQFLKVLNSSTLDYSTLTAKQGKQIISDGDKLIARIDQLAVPPVYADGNRGIVLLLTFLNQEVSFYTVDSSKVPDTNSQSEAVQLIYDGEVNAAKRCPKQVKALGGYIFIDPKQIQDQVDPSK